ncbi:hypothetical protein [Aliivibrio finisterrensis]|uniref:hypothetical protein n=1 Tax=Aliivibrio finisterrensis TaxID=511998 RepID=UPI0013EA230B|nr:hypothetical protein [Aliivibrio finisterrensis]
MNKLDIKNNIVSGLGEVKKMPIKNGQVDYTVNTWDQLTDEQQQEILSHLSEIPFQ